MRVSSVVWVPRRKARTFLFGKDIYHLICFTPLALCISVFAHVMMSTSPVIDRVSTRKVHTTDNTTFSHPVISRCHQIHRYRQVLAENTNWPHTPSFKVTVLTYNRGDSLQRCLEAIQRAFYSGKRIDLYIFIDRSKAGEIYSDAITVATSSTWTHGAKIVNVWNEHVGLYGQWIDTLRPKHHDDFGIILEDDVEVSPYYYLWLARTRMVYSERPDIAGYTLQSGTLRIDQKKYGNIDILNEATEPVLLYGLLSLWGYAPEPRVWADFRRWYHTVSCNKSYDQVFSGENLPEWHKAETRKKPLWTMWHTRYMHERTLYTMHVNLDSLKTRSPKWYELSLHLPIPESRSLERKDFEQFNRSDFDQLNTLFNFPVHPIKFDWNGTFLKRSGKYTAV